MRYIKYFTAVIILCVALLSILYHFYQRGYDKFYSFEKDRMEEIILGKKNHDIIFLGTSRTYHHVNPRIIDSLTQMDSYNAGIDGGNLIEINLALQAYLKNHTPPKLIVADISLLCFAVKRQPFYDPNIYYEFLNNQIIYEALRPYKKVFLLKNLPFVRFAEADDLLRENAMLGLLGRKNVDDKYHYKGFLPYGRDTLELPLKRKYQLKYDIEKNGVDLLNNIIVTCKQRNIKIVLTYAPEYDSKNQNLNDNFFPTLTKIAASQKIPLWDYRNEKICTNHRLFRDEHHLNEIGSAIFSERLANDVKKIL